MDRAPRAVRPRGVARYRCWRRVSLSGDEAVDARHGRRARRGSRQVFRDERRARHPAGAIRRREHDAIELRLAHASAGRSVARRARTGWRPTLSLRRGENRAHHVSSSRAAGVAVHAARTDARRAWSKCSGTKPPSGASTTGRSCWSRANRSRMSSGSRRSCRVRYIDAYQLISYRRSASS